MNGIKITREKWLEMKPVDRDAALFDCLQGIYVHLKRVYIVGGVIVVLFLISNPQWAKFIISKALAAF